MSDINTYANETAIAGLSPINGDLVLNQDNNSLYLCTNAELTGLARWKTFANDGAVTPSFSNTYSVKIDDTDDNGSADLEGTDVMSGDFTLSMWLKAGADSMHSIAQNNYTNTGAGWGLLRFTGNKMAIYQYLPHGYLTGIGYPGVVTTMQNDEWTHIMLARASNTLSLYVNGTSVGSATTSTDYGFKELILNGNYKSTGNSFYDEVAIWSSDQSSNISQIRNTSEGNPIPGDLGAMSTKPTYWWRMGDDDGAGATTITNNSAATGGALSLNLNNGALLATDVAV